MTAVTVTNYGFTASHEKPLLFNIEQDLGERIDRASEHPDIAHRLLGRLDAVSASLKSGAR
jgi:arylsulfatase